MIRTWEERVLYVEEPAAPITAGEGGATAGAQVARLPPTPPGDPPPRGKGPGDEPRRAGSRSCGGESPEPLAGLLQRLEPLAEGEAHESLSPVRLAEEARSRDRHQARFTREQTREGLVVGPRNGREVSEHVARSPGARRSRVPRAGAPPPAARAELGNRRPGSGNSRRPASPGPRRHPPAEEPAHRP